MCYFTFLSSRFTPTESFSLNSSSELDEMILREPPSGIWRLSKLTSLRLHGIGLLEVPESIGEVGFQFVNFAAYQNLKTCFSIPVASSEEA